MGPALPPAHWGAQPGSGGGGVAPIYILVALRLVCDPPPARTGRCFLTSDVAVLTGRGGRWVSNLVDASPTTCWLLEKVRRTDDGMRRGSLTCRRASGAIEPRSAAAAEGAAPAQRLGFVQGRRAGIRGKIVPSCSHCIRSERGVSCGGRWETCATFLCPRS